MLFVYATLFVSSRHVTSCQLCFTSLHDSCNPPHKDAQTQVVVWCNTYPAALQYLVFFLFLADLEGGLGAAAAGVVGVHALLESLLPGRGRLVWCGVVRRREGM